MELIRSIFREYDIRGIYKKELDETTAYLIGRAFGTKLVSLGIPCTVVAHDNRLSSPALESELVRGIIETGTNVKRLGLATSPMCYFAAHYFKTNCYLIITASHNPKEYNGFKFSYNGEHNEYGEAVKEIYTIIKTNNFASGKGTIENVNIDEPYLDLVCNKLTFGSRKVKVVYDCGNGTASVIADKAFNRLKDYIEAIPLYNVSDGTFPNHHPDPCVYENLKDLKKKVLETHADLGIGYDGDADRVGFIDEKGDFIEVDKFLIIMWKFLAPKVENKACLYDVKCTKALEDMLIRLGVKPIEYRTGCSYTRDGAYKGNYPLSGELSGHIYFRDKFPGYDDGVYNGMRLIEMLSYYTQPLSSFLNDVPKYYSTPEIKIKSDDERKFKVVDRVRAYCEGKGYEYSTIDGAKVKFKDGFALIRASNTGPNITMRFEATTEKRMQEIKAEFESVVNENLDIGVVKNTINFSMFNGIVSNEIDKKREEELEELKKTDTKAYEEKKEKLDKSNKRSNTISIIIILLCFALIIYIYYIKKNEEAKPIDTEVVEKTTMSEWIGVYSKDNDRVYISENNAESMKIDIYSSHDDDIDVYTFYVVKDKIDNVITNEFTLEGDSLVIGLIHGGIRIKSSSVRENSIFKYISGDYRKIEYTSHGWDKAYSSGKYGLLFNDFDDHVTCEIYVNGKFNSGFDIYGELREEELIYKSIFNKVEINVELTKVKDGISVKSSSTEENSIFNEINGLTFK